MLYSLKCRNFNNQMYFMTITDEIIIIANQLANQGKKPTVALIKTKLTKAVPLPTIITTLKGWSHEPELTTFNKSETNNIPQNKKIQGGATAAVRNDSVARYCARTSGALRRTWCESWHTRRAGRLGWQPPGGVRMRCAHCGAAPLLECQP